MSHSLIKHQTIKTGILHYAIYMYTECFNCFYFPFRFAVSLQCDAVTFLYIYKNVYNILFSISTYIYKAGSL